MRRMVVSAAASVAAALLLAVGGATAATARPQATPEMASPVAAGIEGPYLADGDTKRPVTIKLFGGGVYRVDAEAWYGVGLCDQKRYWGVYCYRDSVTPPAGVAASGTHLGSVGPDGSIRVHGESANGPGQPFDTVWKPEHPRPPSNPRGLPTPGFQHPVWPPDRAPLEAAPREEPPIQVVPPDEPRPKLEDYVYVEQLPEAITKVPPVYPPDASEAKVEGTVMVQALVGKDGRVKDTRVTKSIPMLDQAAVEAVRQWVFKPALTKGEPVAVWVAIPVRFALH